MFSVKYIWEIPVQVNYGELNERHHLTFDTYEEGKLSLDEYLNMVVFYKKRSFTLEHFKKFLFFIDSTAAGYDKDVQINFSTKISEN